ncbi:hypothetical protein KM043_005160 [Ampulex compressa]|nr:hypothetical protein KM043_005160 [Ampulex compressa]
MHKYMQHQGNRTGPSESRIIGGENATIEEYPFAVSLQNNGTFFGHEVEHFCGGSIIGEKWIITSAQCALRIRGRDVRVRAGTRYYYKDGTIYDIEAVIVHPLFDLQSYDYDFGLVKLTESIKFDDTKRPIELPYQNLVLEDGSTVRVLGWGAKKVLGPISDELRHAAVIKISTEDCASHYEGHLLTNRMFCIFSEEISPCVGDSGSPAISAGTLVGVTSWSRSCAYEYPTAYAAVSEVRSWINEITGIS